MTFCDSIILLSCPNYHFVIMVRLPKLTFSSSCIMVVFLLFFSTTTTMISSQPITLPLGITPTNNKSLKENRIKGIWNQLWIPIIKTAHLFSFQYNWNCLYFLIKYTVTKFLYQYIFGVLNYQMFSTFRYCLSRIFRSIAIHFITLCITIGKIYFTRKE